MVVAWSVFGIYGSSVAHGMKHRTKNFSLFHTGQDLALLTDGVLNLFALAWLLVWGPASLASVDSRLSRARGSLRQSAWRIAASREAKALGELPLCTLQQSTLRSRMGAGILSLEKGWKGHQSQQTGIAEELRKSHIQPPPPSHAVLPANMCHATQT